MQKQLESGLRDFSPNLSSTVAVGIARRESPVVTSQKFQDRYPDGLQLGHMSLVAFDQHLAHFSRRDTPEELWSLGCRFKLAKTIAYIRWGYAITPPIAGPMGKEVILRGGHHRYAIAKAVQLDTIPFLVAPDDVKAIENLLDVTWLGTAD